MIPPCLTLSNIRYVLRVKWSNPEKGVAPSPTTWCCSYRKGSFLVTLDYSHQLYFYLYIYDDSRVQIRGHARLTDRQKEIIIQSSLKKKRNEPPDILTIAKYLKGKKDKYIVVEELRTTR